MTTPTSSEHLPTAVQRRPRGPRGAVHLVLVLVVLVLASGAFAVATASTEGSLGPNEARYSVTLDRRVVIDLGPLGTIQVPSPAPRPLGVRVVLGEIPSDVQSVGDVSSITTLATDADAYLQLFADRDALVSDVVRGLAEDAARRFAWCLLGIAGVVGLGAALLGRERGRVLVQHARPWAAPVAFVVIVAMGAGATAVWLRPMPLDGRTSVALAGTSLSQTRITGRLADAIDTFGATVVKAYHDNEAFYAEANDNLVKAWDAADTSDAVTPLQAPGATTTGPVAPQPSSSAAPGTSTPSAGPDDDVRTLLVVADIHCNTGMSPLIRTAVDRSGATVVLHAGDATIDGSSVEKICVTSVTKAAGDATVVFAGGNHDGPATAEQFADAGAVVLHGSTKEVDGITILGDVDPFVSRSGQPTRLVGDETEDEAGQRLAQAACEQHPDLLLIHNPAVGAPALASGCVPYQVSGHLHRRVGPEQDGPGVLYVNASTAGAVPNQLTVGPLHGTAEMTVLRYDVTTEQMLSYRIVSVSPDRSASVGPWTPYPVPTGVVSDQEG